MPTTLLEMKGVAGGYGQSRVIHGVDLVVREGAVVALLGANGAGKTTLLRMASGQLKPAAGTIRIVGEDMTRKAPEKRARAGLCHLPEGRAIFPALSVRENLDLLVPPWRKDRNLDEVMQIFPRLGERLKQRAGSLSGGEQQMLALARAFLADPLVVLADELSMGLAPVAVDEVFEALRRLCERGVALLLVEQYVNRALDMADIVYLLRRGEVAASGPASAIDGDAVISAYLGVDGLGANVG
jgi:branched-chain amino acid transport system ATP-binding protein